MMAYRSELHETTYFTPCELMFGRQIYLPTDLHFGRPKQACVSIGRQHDRVDKHFDEV